MWQAITSIGYEQLEVQIVFVHPCKFKKKIFKFHIFIAGFSNAVLRPKTTEEVSKIVKYCNDNKLAVCPQGGNTGLVGGSVPVFDEVVISTGLMNQIIHLDEFSGKKSNCSLITVTVLQLRMRPKTERSPARFIVLLILSLLPTW